MKHLSNSDSLTLLQLIQLLLTTPTRWREFRTNDTKCCFHVNNTSRAIWHWTQIAASSGTPLFARHKLRRLVSNVTSLLAYHRSDGGQLST